MEAYCFYPIRPAITELEATHDPLDYPEYADFIREGGSTKPIPPHLVKCIPRHAVIVSGQVPPPPWEMCYLWCVTPAIKTIVEELEPGVHQFFPITILDKFGSGQTFEHYLIHINQQIDDVVLEGSSLSWREVPRDGGKTERRWMKSEGPLVLPEHSISGKHLWRNRRAQIDLMSGMLYDRLTAANLTGGLRFQQQIVQ